MSDQLPYMPGPQKVDCPDGCGLFGRPTRNGHVRGCQGPPGAPCRSCLGRRNRVKGRRKQRDAQKALGLVGPGKSFGANHEENWTGLVRVEVKAGAQVRPAITAFRKMRDQSEASRPYGDHRPFVGVAMGDGGHENEIVMIRLEDVMDFALAVIAGEQENVGD